MNRTTTNFWLDVLSLLVMLGLTFTGGIVHFVLPAGTGHFDLLFGLGRHDIGQIHFCLAVVAVALLAVHVLLHWSWVCCVAGKLLGAKPPSGRTQTVWALSLVGGVSLLGGIGLWWASSRVEHNAATWAQRGAQRNGYLLDRRGLVSWAADADRVEQQTASSQKDVQEPVSAERAARAAPDRDSEQCPAGAAIDGRSTLADVAGICGLTVEEVKVELKLPHATDSGERLGRLKRRYDFAIHDARRLACRQDS